VSTAKSAKRNPARGVVGLFIRLTKAAFVAVLLAVVWSVGFIAIKCRGGNAISRPSDATAGRAPTGIANYQREEVATYLSLPEWYIVYNTDEYARSLTSHPPSGFSYLGSIRQYWRYYGAVCDATKEAYPFSAGNHVMLGVLGSSFSIEYALKGLYENTVGRLTEWLAGHDTPEDVFARNTATEYGAFMHTVPFYEFPFGAKIVALWNEVPAMGPHMIRKWERRLALTSEYGIKAVYSAFIGLGSNAAYGEQDLRIHATIENAGAQIYASGDVKRVKVGHGGATIVTLPRYEAFTAQMLTLLRQGVRFLDIAGNDEILMTVLAPSAWTARELQIPVLLDETLLTDGATRRIALKVPIRRLHVVAPQIQRRGGSIEHLYDY
jgi:hypothetical protein